MENVIAGSDAGLAAALAARLGRHEWGSGAVQQQVWWLPSGDTATDRPAERELLSLAADVYNVVAPHGMVATMVPACRDRGLRWRLFSVPPALDGPDDAAAGVPRLLAVLAGVRAEVSRRQPGYLDSHLLRLLVEQGAQEAVVTVGAIADALCAIAAGDDSAGTHWWLRADVATPLLDICRRVSEAWQLPIETVTDPEALTPVDRYVDDLLARATWPRGEAPPAAREYPVPALGPSAQVSALRAVALVQLEAQSAAEAREQAIPDLLGAVRLERHGGAVLRYRSGGVGARPLVIVNAIGQGLAYWYPLLARLLPRRRVVAWELRDERPDGNPTRFADHVEDLGAILEAEGVSECDLLGWCAGAKVALRHCRQRPDQVRSMILLNGAFKHPGRDPGLDSVYERNLERMCLALERRPERADALRRVFAPDSPGEVTTDRVLATTDPRLREEVNRPFGDATRMVRYAQQLLDFWSVDVTADLREVDVPVLAAAGEYDQVVTPAGVREAAALLRRGRFVELSGATHYRMFDRPDLVASLVERFLGEQHGGD